jgi:PAS domain S-box-containing protein
MKFRNRLLISVLLVFLPLIIAGGTFTYYQMKKMLETSIEKELHQTTQSLFSLIETTASIAIRNRLGAIAEKNFDLTEYYYSKHRSGLLTRQEAIDTLEEIFLNQSIGISGYVYCLNSNGDVVIHPDHRVRGSNVSDYSFVRQQLAIKDGYLEYDWKNPGEPRERPKALYMVYYKPLDWIISVSAYRNEFSHLVNIDDFKDTVLSFKSGDSGYAYILDKNGKALIHPALEGANLLDQTDQSTDFLHEMLNREYGKLTYFWKNPEEALSREKQVIFKHMPRFDWIIGSTSYMDEVFAPLKTFKQFLGIIVLLMALAGVFLALLVSRWITRPLDNLVTHLKIGAKGDLSVRMPHDTSDELGQLAGHFNTFMKKLENQIQENAAARAALVDSELKLRGLFDQSFQYSGILSCDGTLEKVNRSALEMGGLTEEQVLAKPIWETPWWPPEAAALLKDQCVEAMKGTLVRFETINLSHSREIRNVDISIKPVTNQKGSIEFLILEGRDITDLKQAEAQQRKMATQLQKAQKMEAIGTLAGGIAHDFNNILSGIFGYTQLAQMSLATTPEKAQTHLNQVLKGAQRAADLIQQILTFSRQTKYRKKPLKIHLIVKEALKLMRSTIPTTIDIQAHIRFEALVLADPTQMHQVIMNLCTNAYHAMMPGGGTLTLILENRHIDRETAQDLCVRAGDYMKLTVKDTGHGMDEDTLTKVFDPYFTTKAPGKGTGLGLALVQAIVSEHQGVVHVVSQPGEGTTFNVYLPLIEAVREFENKKPPSRVVGGTETIMVVDDEEDIRLLIKELLENMGYSVIICEDGVQALSIFRQSSSAVDLVITDMTMPRMAGDALAAELFCIKKDLPVILWSGYSEQISESRAMRLGIALYMTKPIQNQELLIAIRKILDTRK